MRTIRVLATDLDGTFLGGSDAARRALTAHFRDHPERRLLYVTGRSSRSVTRKVEQGILPRPDAMICDVGAFIAQGNGEPDEGPVLAGIRSLWGDRSGRVLRAFESFEGLRLQEYFGPHRVSFYYDSPDVLPGAHARADSLGCDGLDSDGRFFDVLPRGVNKGTTLRRLMAEWGMAEGEVLVAGDTLNDLAMLTEGFQAVAVGNSEPALLARLPRTERLTRAEGHGCDGILEALALLEARIPHV